jgi:hypothetical protein
VIPYHILEKVRFSFVFATVVALTASIFVNGAGSERCSWFAYMIVNAKAANLQSVV